jgi:integrase
MRGHIRERSPGRWAIVIRVPDRATGKKRLRWHSFKGTKREAQKECARLIAELARGAYVEPSKTTLAEFFGRWLDAIKPQVAPRTLERYSELALKNIVPLLGDVILTKLRPEQISAAYGKALSQGRADGTGGLSPRTVHHMHRILKQALGHAVRWQLLVRNPCDAVDPPKVERKPLHVLDVDGTAELIEAARDHSLFVPILLGLTTGMRRGEVVALRWKNVDLANGQLAVVESAEQTKAGVRYKPPKNGKARTVAMSATLVEELRAHRVRQAEGLLKLGMRLTDNHFVVAQTDGSPLQPRSLTHAFEKFLDKRGLQHVRLHDLRHTHATAMLSAGIHPKVAQERLGHSSVSVTIDLYSQVMPGMQVEAAGRVDAALQDAIDRRRKNKGLQTG